MGLRRKKAFTLIELVMVIIVLGILSIVAIARYFDLANDARAAAEKGAVAGIVVGIHSYFSSNKTFPDALDGASVGTCNSSNACFTNILSLGGITEEWSKSGANSYVGPTGKSYTYASDEGTFE